MKLAIGIIIFVWLLCGAIGAKMMGDLDSHHLMLIARGGVTLAEALDEHPVSYPGPD